MHWRWRREEGWVEEEEERRRRGYLLHDDEWELELVLELEQERRWLVAVLVRLGRDREGGWALQQERRRQLEVVEVEELLPSLRDEIEI